MQQLGIWNKVAEVRTQEVDAGKRNTNYTWLYNCGA